MQKRFPRLERELEEVLIKYVSEVADEFSPLMKDIPTQRLFEGNASSAIREDGERDETEMRQFSTELQIPTDTILYGTINDIAEIFTPLGRELVSQKERVLFQSVEEWTEKTGNVVNSEGKPFSMEKLLELFEKIHIDFDDQGKPRMPTFVAGKEIMEQFRRLSEEPVHQRAFNAIMVRKKAEWLAREADRTLVG